MDTVISISGADGGRKGSFVGLDGKFAWLRKVRRAVGLVHLIVNDWREEYDVP